MKVLELFAGSRSVGRAGGGLGYTIFSTDVFPFEGIDYAVDILEFDYEKVPFVPDILWASPPCTGFSVAAIGRNWSKGSLVPKTETATLGLKLLHKTIEMIDHYTNINPNLIWYIENPRGMMRKMPCMENFFMQTVTYCQYGDNRMKPTDIWTNNFKWRPRPPCKNGDTCHVAAPRGSSTGTQGLKGAYERSKIPEALCIEILQACK